MKQTDKTLRLRPSIETRRAASNRDDQGQPAQSDNVPVAMISHRAPPVSALRHTEFVMNPRGRSSVKTRPHEQQENVCRDGAFPVSDH